MTKFTGINHLAMATGDMEKTIRFWRDLLGMRLVAGLGRPGFRHYFFEISENDCIAFFEWDGVEPVEKKDHGYPVRGPFVFDHLSIGVETEKELYDLKDKLEAAGFSVSDAMDHGFIHSIYAFDPNGIPIEFSWPVPGRDIRKTPVLVDKGPSETALEGPDPQPGQWPDVTKPTPQDWRVAFAGAGMDLFEKPNHFGKKEEN
ncbi:VOC family protein [Desulfatibacillum aliphaticivorans]|uniref:VOC family protein n=1 Tax=Desulfatibacillum aliphaticivorans TaxID=218208 RepID=UPI0003F5E947|nr:VOC family protein [Desulfatibacillum aliphaticivorans]